MFQPNWFNWRYRNTALLAISILVLIIFADHAIIRGLIDGITGLGYLGLFFAGMFYVSTFTIVPATVLLSEMTKVYGFWEVTILATMGAVSGDYIIFRFIKDTVSEELKPFLESMARQKHIYNLFHTPFFAWLLPVIGAVVIASPLPDEMGLSILGLSQMNNKRFLALVIALDFVGIGLMVSLLKSL